jgi:hypothetical protein
MQSNNNALTLVADLLTPFSEAACLSLKDAQRTVRKRVVVSLAFADVGEVHKRLFAGQHLDWVGVQEYLQDVVFTAQDWLQIVRLLDFVQDLQVSHETTELLNTAFAGLRLSSTQTKGLSALDSLRLCFARVKLVPSWDTLCKAFVLCNVADMDPLTALLLLFSETPDLPQVSVETAKDLVRYMGAYKHTRVEYTDMFAQVLDDVHCQVRSHAVLLSVKQRDQLKEARRQHAIRTGAAFRKPSLTQMLEAKLLTEGARHPHDSFASFCRTSKIAANVNHRVKQVAYYLVCLPEQHHGGAKIAHLTRVVGEDPIVLESIQGLNITSPDVQELRRIVMDTHYTEAPSETLRRFKDRCLTGCLIAGGKRTVHWSTVMRLYLAAYCRPDVGKDLWSYVLHSESQGTLFLRASPETESMVQGFTRAHPMALGEILEALLPS